MATTNNAESFHAPAQTLSFWNERHTAYAILLACVLLLISLRFWFMTANSATADELVHIESGYRYWQCGDYGVSPENPPLAKLVAAFPVRHWQLAGFPGPCGSQVTPSRGPDYFVATAWLLSSYGPALLWKARAALILFPLALLLLVFFAARSFFGYKTAAIAAILLAFEPTLIAHGSLATTDTAFAACLFAAVWAAYEFAGSPSPGRFLLLGVAMGLTIASKMIGLLVPWVVLILMLLLPDLRRPLQLKGLLRRLAAWVGACFVAWIVLWSTYAFRYSALPHSAKPNYNFAKLFESAGLSESWWPALTSFLANHHFFPESFVAGLATMKMFDASPAYFFGNVYPEGVWYYYPLALLIKLTVPVMAFAVVALASGYLWQRNSRALLTMLIPTVLFLGVVMTAQVNMGVRHILPVYPLLIILAAAGASVLLSRSRTAAIVATALIALHVVSSLRSAPGQISYANELTGGSNHLYRYLDDSNLDWGQSDAQLAAYVQSHHVNNCAVAWSFPHRSSPSCLGLPTLINDLMSRVPWPALPDSFTGTVLLEPTAVVWTDGYLPLLRRKPDEIIAHGSVLVYRGTFDMRPLSAVRHLYRGMGMLFMAHDALHALDEFAAADRDCPAVNRPMHEQFYASTLLALHRSAEAKAHFQKLLKLTEGHASFRDAHQTAVEALKKL